jgi:Ca-activated chloride channel family protein
MNPGISLYEMLNITRDASAEEIREAYFEAARRYHPDVNTDKNANEQFMHIQQAYETLLDSAKRARYDTELAKMDDQAGVRVDTYYSVARIPQLAEPQVVYVLLEFNCLARKEKSQPPPVHVCLVIDCSTSMQGERLDLVKTNVLQLVRQLRVQDILSVVTFNDRAEKLIVDARGVEHKGAENQISLLMASGGTEIFKGLEAGMSLLRPTKGRATRLMILITDGRTYGDENACLNLARHAAQEEVTLHTAGLGSEWNDSLLDQLAGLTRLYARSMRLSGRVDEGIELRSASRISPEVMELPLDNPIMLGPLLAGKPMHILLEYIVRPIPRQFKYIQFLEGSVKVDLVTTAISEESYRVHLRRPLGTSAEDYVMPTAILDAVAKFNLFRLQERARIEMATGNTEQAARRLQHVATNLLAQGEKEMANMVINEVRNIQRTQSYSEDGDKRLKYATRGLMLPSGMENE